MKTGIELIAEERARQVYKEGWTSEHDDEHAHEEMATAAACYALPDHLRKPTSQGIIPGSPRSTTQRVRVPWRWPWDAEGWKPTPEDRIKELTKAGALIAAEIDRLQRAERPKSKQRINTRRPDCMD